MTQKQYRNKAFLVSGVILTAITCACTPTQPPQTQTRTESTTPITEPETTPTPTPTPTEPPRTQAADLPACVKSDCNCDDFATPEEAQRVFDAYPGDPFKLDRDKDGLACESN